MDIAALSSFFLTIAHAIRLTAYKVNPIDLTMEVILETSDTLTLQLSWREETGASYNVSISPEATMTYLTENSTVWLTLSHNVEYNVSIVATVCKRDNYTTTIRLKYGKTVYCNSSTANDLCCESSALSLILNTVNCGHPLLHHSQDTTIFMMINDYTDTQPVVYEGTVLNFSCPPGLVLSGPNTTTCMENGEWEPDPRQTMCKGC